MMTRKVCRRVTGMVIGLIVASLSVLKAENAEPELRVMSFNLLRGGAGRGQPLSQSAKVIEAAGADLVGLQEAGGKATELAKILGWNASDNGPKAILTRHEIVGRHQSGVRVRLPSGREFYAFNVHFKPAPYQPYQLLGIPYGQAPFLKTEAEAVASAWKTRGPQVEALLKEIGSLPEKDLPVFLTGDFNEPSHLDWTARAAEAGRHPIKVAYPVSLALAKAGFEDAWRRVYPDELAKPGFTWTPMTKADDPKDHHDRIDFVYLRGGDLRIRGAQVIGENKENADLVVAPYPSDHRAVVASVTFADATE